jgi:hypothetical protein
VGDARRLGLSLDMTVGLLLRSSDWLEGEADFEVLAFPTVLGFAIFWPSAVDCALPMAASYSSKLKFNTPQTTTPLLCTLDIDLNYVFMLVECATMNKKRCNLQGVRSN